MNMTTQSFIEHWKSRFVALRTTVAVAARKLFDRSCIVLPEIIRILLCGIRTRVKLRRTMGEPWVSRNFPELQAGRLMRYVCRMVPLIWTDNAADAASAHISPGELKRIKHTLQRLPHRDSSPHSAAARRICRAAFARCASVVTQQPIPRDLVNCLRADRSLRDLMLTWIDLIQITTFRPNSQNIQSSLAVHASLALPPGDRLPLQLRRQLSGVRAELNASLRNKEIGFQSESLRRQVLLTTSEVLTVPMAFAAATPERHGGSRP